MNFEEFIKTIAPKVGAKNAFDLAKDARIQALEKILIDKLNVDQKDIEETLNTELKQLAENILKMPPIPNN